MIQADMIQVDGRRKQGHDPMARVKEILEKSPVTHIRVRVDNDQDADKVSLFLDRRGFGAGVDSDGTNLYVEGIKSGRPDPAPMETQTELPDPAPGTLVVIASAGIGPREDELAATLMEGYIQALTRPDCRPDCLLFVHEGVRLPFDDMRIRAALDSLVAAGVRLFFCRTSLDFFGLDFSELEFTADPISGDDTGILPAKTVAMSEFARLLNRAEKRIRL